MKLRQSDFFSSREFELMPTALHYIEDNFTSSLELNIPYDQITSEQPIKRSRIPRFAPYLSTLIGLVLVNMVASSNIDSGSISISFIIIFIGCVLFTLMFRRNELVILTAKGELAMWENYPDVNTVITFKTDLDKAIRQYMLDAYFQDNKAGDKQERLANLDSILQGERITTEEYEQLKSRIVNDASPPKEEIGFLKRETGDARSTE
jgi:hypothetical protein